MEEGNAFFSYLFLFLLVCRVYFTFPTLYSSRWESMLAATIPVFLVPESVENVQGIPYEPTSLPRAMQQVGRVLRIGSKHEWIRVIHIQLNSALDRHSRQSDTVSIRTSLAINATKSDVADGDNADASFRIGHIVAIDGDFVNTTEEELIELNLPGLTEGIMAAMIANAELNGSTALTPSELQVSVRKGRDFISSRCLFLSCTYMKLVRIP
ncbi:hypothetical protein E4T38_03716 [Aureobasidium subglaciale]|nr:hypothetical protein E4T38_03716 [Aureobasidium subglaciale]KAI5224973.1 hypothetical protein E4T41_05464 [Aureobasidium subglaciale]KAI5225323.1 hypothetical protein E4T40_03491 [Aureobasidium subglaciale]KAI5261138.1 hypothetical protein E4T46_05357 [Aureobasidium subglaciale]